MIQLNEEEMKLVELSKKKIKSEWGESEIAVPCDRKGTFEPKIIQKRQTRTDDIEVRILALYQGGKTQSEISKD